MTTQQVRLTLDLTGADCGYIATTAAEGGIGYWSVIDSYDYTRWFDEDDGAYAGAIEVDLDFVFYTLHEYDDIDGPGDGLDVTPVIIRRGVQQWLDEGRKFADMSDLAAMDADEADCVIQYGLFGEVIYG
jgi:hypothetical protein